MTNSEALPVKGQINPRRHVECSESHPASQDGEFQAVHRACRKQDVRRQTTLEKSLSPPVNGEVDQFAREVVHLGDAKYQLEHAWTRAGFHIDKGA